MATVRDNVVAYDSMRAELEAKHMGEWVIVYDEKLAGLYPDFHEAAKDAVARFGRGAYHIKQIGEPPFTLKPLILFGPRQNPSVRDASKRQPC